MRGIDRPLLLHRTALDDEPVSKAIRRLRGDAFHTRDGCNTRQRFAAEAEAGDAEQIRTRHELARRMALECGLDLLGMNACAVVEYPNQIQAAFLNR
ncbi:hypothetical protein D3C84_1104340 [compost metagenome]